MEGNGDYLRGLTIKDESAYKQDTETSPYDNHVYWQEVWGPKYGMMPEPPYATVKIPLTTEKKKAFKEWVSTMEDADLKQRLMQYATKKDKWYQSTLYLPADVLQAGGLPKELEGIISARRATQELCKGLYLFLETLGVHLSQGKVRYLASDIIHGCRRLL